MMGDGGINNPWQANITLNSNADFHYISYVKALGKKLFGVTPAIRKRKIQKAVDISFASTSMVDFLVSQGLYRGNKIDAGLRIPDWILADGSYRKACVRGLMDTDGCLYVHRHTVANKFYRNIGLCFSSFSPPLMAQVGVIFEEFSIIPHITKDGRKLYLYSRKAVARYMAVFGSSNERIISVYKTNGGVG
jgi:intein/homing endonuclease